MELNFFSLFVLQWPWYMANINVKHWILNKSFSQTMVAQVLLEMNYGVVLKRRWQVVETKSLSFFGETWVNHHAVCLDKSWLYVGTLSPSHWLSRRQSARCITRLLRWQDICMSDWRDTTRSRVTYLEYLLQLLNIKRSRESGEVSYLEKVILVHHATIG